MSKRQGSRVFIAPDRDANEVTLEASSSRIIALGTRDITVVRINRATADRAMKKAMIAHLKRRRDERNEDDLAEALI
ncbi:hypothetical protein [Marinobacterium sedimentorum]|uniref:hypothetical protein n=1 Tax=Marinobacterium sedimentorum TaxID=2927804 RepID=UPI0020C5C708|nr:hypothetical protein [Marinobacterium sedimentorum]